MPINTGTAPITGAEALAVRVENEFKDIVRHVTYGRRRPFSSGGRQPQPNAQALDSRVIVNCYNHGERQELIVQIRDGVQPRVAAERIGAALKEWFPVTTEGSAPTAGPSGIPSPSDSRDSRRDAPPPQPATVPPQPTKTPPADPLKDHADFFAAHADLVEIMERTPLPVIEEVWLRLQAVKELGWEVTIEDGRPTFRRKRS